MLCILILPQFFGVYAYVIGMGASFLINAVCSLVFLNKKCPIFQKGRGQVRVQTIFGAIISILPLSLIGQFFNQFLKNYYGELTALFLTALLLSCAIIVTYALLGILPIKSVFRSTLATFKKTRKNI